MQMLMMSLYASALNFTQPTNMCKSQLCRFLDLIVPRKSLWVILLMLIAVGESRLLNVGTAPCMSRS